MGGATLVSCPDCFFFFCVGANKKKSSGSPVAYLCSQIYNFWGSGFVLVEDI